MTRSSASAGMGGPSSSLTLEEDEDSDGGRGELDGRSAGKIMLAGINASTTASLVNHKTCPVSRSTDLSLTESRRIN